MPAPLLVLAFCLFAGINLAEAQSTTFTYQGQRYDSSSPANGYYDLSFALYPLSAGGSAVGPLVTRSEQWVAGGLFTVTLDFGNVFNGSSYWLEIGVRTNGSSNGFTTLTPRQSVAGTPCSQYSLASGSVTGVLSATNLPPNVAMLNGNVNFTGTVTASNFVANGSPLPITNVNGMVPVASGGTGTNSARGSGNNIGVLMASPPGGNDGFADIANATPSFRGQLATSSYGFVVPFLWSAYGTGKGQFIGSWVLPGRISVGDSTHMNPTYDIGENPFIANGTSATLDPLSLSNPADNVISLKNQHLRHYSAMRWLSADADGLGERGAIGYGNSLSGYPAINYLEDFGNESGFYFVTASAGICFGMERQTGDLVRCTAGTQASNETANVVFRVNQTGSITQSQSASDTFGSVTEGNTKVNGSITISGTAGIRAYGPDNGMVDFFDSSGSDLAGVGNFGLAVFKGGLRTCIASKKV